MTAKTKPARSQELAVQRDQLEQVARSWVAKITEAELSVASYLDQAGGLVLDDPDAAERIAAEGAQKQATVALAGKAIPEALRRHQEAAKAVLAAQADELDPQITKAQGALDSHLKRRDQLLAELSEFSGADWREAGGIEDDNVRRIIQQHGSVTVRTPKHRGLTVEVSKLKSQQGNLRQQSGSLAPLVIADEAWASASDRLVAAGGQLSELSQAHLARVHAARRTAAEQDAQDLEADWVNAVGVYLESLGMPEEWIQYGSSRVRQLLERPDLTTEQEARRDDVWQIDGELRSARASLQAA